MLDTFHIQYDVLFVSYCPLLYSFVAIYVYPQPCRPRVYYSTALPLTISQQCMPVSCGSIFNTCNGSVRYRPSLYAHAVPSASICKAVSQAHTTWQLLPTVHDEEETTRYRSITQSAAVSRLLILYTSQIGGVFPCAPSLPLPPSTGGLQISH